LTRRLIKGFVSADGTVDDRDPLSEQDLTSLLQALRHVGYTSYNLSLCRAMFALMVFGFLRISEVIKHRHNLLYNQCTVISACVNLTFNSYKHSHIKLYKLDVPALNSRPCPHKLLTRYLSCAGPHVVRCFFKPTGNLFLVRISRESWNLRSRTLTSPGVLHHTASVLVQRRVQLLRGIPLNRLRFLDAGGLTHTCPTFWWLIAKLHGDFLPALLGACSAVCLFVCCSWDASP